MNRHRPARRPAAVAPALLSLLLAGPAKAEPGVPSPSNSTVPCAIVVVPAPAAAAAHEFEVVHRDLANNPVPGAVVTIDFSACGSDVRVAQQQRPGTSTSCPAQTVSQITDADGRAVFRVIGGGSSVGPCAAHGVCAQVYADGVLLANIQAAVLDLDGATGLSAADLSLFLSDFFSGPVAPGYCARSDYSYVTGGCSSQEVTASDLAIWFSAYFVQGGTWATPLCAP